MKLLLVLNLENILFKLSSWLKGSGEKRVNARH